MPSLIFVTQVVDPDDPVLGFVVPQLRALADRCTWLGVVANEVRSVPSAMAGIEVASMGKELGHGKVRRTARYLSVLRQWIDEQDVDAVFLHMCPPYVNVAAPVTAWRSVPTLLWYTHPTQTLSLRLATRLATRVLTTDERSFPNPIAKVKPIGQAIDATRFALTPLPDAEGIRLAAIGRPSPLKRYDVAIRAVHRCREHGLDASLRIIGSAATEVERDELTRLHALVADLSVGSAVSFEPGRPQATLPAVLADIHALVNTTVGGSADKVVYEAMAAGRPVLVSTPAFTSLTANVALDLVYPEGNHVVLAERIEALGGAPQGALERTGQELRRRVIADHSLTHWADEVVQVVHELVATGRPTKRTPWSRSGS
jgi:glycosyltransferase involved in cell wall biosynthesis